MINSHCNKLNYISILDISRESEFLLEHWLKEYEKSHQKYFNPEFIDYLQAHDPEAELIDISDISY